MGGITLILLAIVLAVFTSGCEDKRVPELQSRIAQLEQQLQKIKRQLSDAETEFEAVESAVTDVNSAIDDLESDDSPDVIDVMTTRAAAETLEMAVNQLKSTIEDAVSTAN